MIAGIFGPYRESRFVTKIAGIYGSYNMVPIWTDIAGIIGPPPDIGYFV